MMPNILRERPGIVWIRSINDFILSGKAKYGIPSIISASPKTLKKYAITVITPLKVLLIGRYHASQIQKTI
jgi:hypothetical protein